MERGISGDEVSQEPSAQSVLSNSKKGSLRLNVCRYKPNYLSNPKMDWAYFEADEIMTLGGKPYVYGKEFLSPCPSTKKEITFVMREQEDHDPCVTSPGET